MDRRITLAKLQQLKQRAVSAGRLERALEIEGLTLGARWFFPKRAGYSDRGRRHGLNIRA